MSSQKSLRITQSKSGEPNNLEVPIHVSGSDRIKIEDNIYDLTPEIYKTFSSYNGKTMKDESDILEMYNIIRGLGYTGKGDKNQTERHFHRSTS